MEKVITYLKQFTEQQRTCLAIYTALCISENVVNAGVISELFREHLVKDESLSLAFATTLFTVWLKEKSIANVGSALRKVNLESKLLVSGKRKVIVGGIGKGVLTKKIGDKNRKERQWNVLCFIFQNILPPAKRRDVVFDEHFTQAGLQELVVFRKTQQSSRIRKKLREEVGKYKLNTSLHVSLSHTPFNARLDEFLQTNTKVLDITDHCQETLENNETLTIVNVTVILWKSIMSVIEWNTKEDLLEAQALGHLEVCSVCVRLRTFWCGKKFIQVVVFLLYILLDNVDFLCN